MNEIWRDIIGYEGRYQISNKGNVRFFDSRIIIGQSKHPKGYKQVGLYKCGKSRSFLVHRLVAINFIENSSNFPQVNHIDGNKENNNAENLEWCSNSYNQLHRIKVLKYKPSCPEREVEMRDKQSHHVINKYRSVREASRQTGINCNSIYNNCHQLSKSAGGFRWNFKK